MIKSVLEKYREHIPMKVLAELLAVIDEMEKDCCEWKFFEYSNSLYENHGDFRTDEELANWTFCPYCGKRIKRIEVE